MTNNVVEKKPILLPDDAIERIFLKKIYTDDAYTLLAKDYFDKRWFYDANISLLANVITNFWSDYNKKPSKEIIGQIIRKLKQDDETIDVDAALEAFDDSMTSAFTADDQYLELNVIDFIKRRGLYFAIVDNLEKIEKKQDVNGIIDNFSKIVNVSLDADLGFDYFKDHAKHMEYIKDPSRRIATGMRDLDILLGGGLLKDGNCLWVPLGRPGLGKSALLSNLAVNFLAQDESPLILTLELSDQLYMSRIDAHIADIEINKLTESEGEVKSKVAEFRSKHSKGRLIVKEYPPSSISVAHIENYLNKLITRGMKPSVLLVDYIMLMLPKFFNGKMGTYEKVGEIAKELRGLSKKYKIPVIAPAQVNRSGYTSNQNTGMEHTAESAGINHHSDLITVLYQTDEMRKNQLLNQMILKNRLAGNVGKIFTAHFNNRTLRISDTEQPGFIDAHIEEVQREAGSALIEM